MYKVNFSCEKQFLFSIYIELGITGALNDFKLIDTHATS